MHDVSDAVREKAIFVLGCLATIRQGQQKIVDVGVLPLLYLSRCIQYIQHTLTHAPHTHTHTSTLFNQSTFVGLILLSLALSLSSLLLFLSLSHPHTTHLLHMRTCANSNSH
jgi:hypothetical protein